MEKNKPRFGDRKIGDALQTGWVCSGAWLILRLYGCNLPERDSFFFIPPRSALRRSTVLQREQERGRPANRGSKSPRTMMPLVLGFWLGERTWES